MWKSIISKMRKRKVVLMFVGSRSNRDNKITKRAIMMSNVQVCSVKCIAMKFLIVANAVNFLYYGRGKKNCKKENR